MSDQPTPVSAHVVVTMSDGTTREIELHTGGKLYVCLESSEVHRDTPLRMPDSLRRLGYPKALHMRLDLIATEGDGPDRAVYTLRTSDPCVWGWLNADPPEQPPKHRSDM